MKFGFSVNTYAIGDLVVEIDQITDQEVADLVAEYEGTYTLADNAKVGGSHRQHVLDAAKIELGIKKFFEKGGYKGFTDSFEDLHGMVQLPGIAAQRLMEQG